MENARVDSVNRPVTMAVQRGMPSGTAAGCTTMSYTLAEAATACGINKSTVLRAVKAGRISGTKDEFGTWHVEAVELHRIFPPAAAAAASPEALPRHAPPDAAADALVAELRAVIADLRQDRSRRSALHYLHHCRCCGMHHPMRQEDGAAPGVDYKCFRYSQDLGSSSTGSVACWRYCSWYLPVCFYGAIQTTRGPCL